MDPEKLKRYRELTADTPQSIMDGAPRVLKLDCGVSIRIAGPLDCRIMNRIIEWAEKEGEPLEDNDAIWFTLFCCMHTTPEEIAKLWTLARKPEKLFAAYMNWLANSDSAFIVAAGQEIAELDAELEAEHGLDAGEGGADDDGKKKTG